MAYDTKFEAGMVLGILSATNRLDEFVDRFKLRRRAKLRSFAESLAPTKAGIAEVVIPPGSDLVGNSARDVWLRKVYGLGLIALHRDGETLRAGDKNRNMSFHTGDTLVVHQCH